MENHALVPLLYEELRAIARRQLSGDRIASSLRPTELVHEAFLRLESSGIASPDDRNEVLALASTLMRNLLVDRARRRQTIKRGGDLIRVPLFDETASIPSSGWIDILALDRALTRLEDLDQRAAKVVQLRFFGGLTEAEIAAQMNITDRWVRKIWAHARAWLYRELSESDSLG